MNKKRLFSGISSAVLMLGALSPVQALAQGDEMAFVQTAQTIEAEGKLGNTAEWKLRDHVLTIKGEFDNDNIYKIPGEWPWYKHREDVHSVKFENGSKLSGSAYGLFAQMINLKDIDFNGLDTSGVTSMKDMFWDCKSLTSLNLSSFDTSNVTDMFGMFYNCTGLISLDISNFDTSKVKTMESMFAICNHLTSLELGEMETSSVETMHCMFLSCSALPSIDLSSFDTSNVKDMYEMFYGCANLSSINLENFDTTGVKDFSMMFGGCPNLTYLDLTPLWIVPDAKIDRMFTYRTRPQAVQINQTCIRVLEALEEVSPKWHFNQKGPHSINEIQNLIKGEKSALLELSLNYYLNYEGNGSDVVKLPTNQMGKSETGKYQFTIAQNTPERLGYSFLGWAESPNATTAQYKAGNQLTLTTGKRAITLYGIWSKNPSSGTSSGSSSSGSVARSSVHEMHRMYNPNSGEHFYTKEIAERDYLVNVGWQYEGTAWYSPKSSGSPVYRLYNPNAGDHHYTLSASERDELVRVGWKDEGIGWYSANSRDGQAVHRQYNPNAVAGSHNFTTDEYERDYLINNGWNHEGVAWYGVHPKNIKK